MNIISGNIKYILINKTFFINNIDALQHNIIKCKNDNVYIHYIMNYIKDNIFKNYNNLKNIKIKIEIFNKDNYIHQFALAINNKLCNMFYNDYNRMILIFIYEYDKLIFIGNI